MMAANRLHDKNPVWKSASNYEFNMKETFYPEGDLFF